MRYKQDHSYYAVYFPAYPISSLVLSCHENLSEISGHNFLSGASSAMILRQGVKCWKSKKLKINSNRAHIMKVKIFLRLTVAICELNLYKIEQISALTKLIVDFMRNTQSSRVLLIMTRYS